MNYETHVTGGVLPASDFGTDEASLAKRRRTIIIAAIVALLIIAFVAFKLFWGKGGDDAAAANAEQAQTVTVAVARSQSVTTLINATGTVGAVRDMPVGVVGEGGQVQRVLVEPGAWVEKGQPLLVIERSVQTQEVASLAAQVDVARADAKLAQTNLDRSKQLVANGFVSKAQIDQLTATRDAAAARVNVAIATLNQARARVGRLDLRAPASGLILTRSVEPGQIVQGGSGALFRIAEGGRLEVQARLDESALANIHVGTSATVIPTGATQRFTGNVWQISPVIDPQSRLGIARIALPYDKALRPGGFANVEVAAGSAQAPLMPESAIQSDMTGSYVLLVGKDNKIERRAIKTGTVTAQGVPITAGLSGGEKVVLYAAGFLNPGEVVKPKVQQPGTGR